ncbi:MAG: biotin--[acetyl-CoA-carboxylase] ligase [Candidatus Omnitrophica bacterium]|nr:biotin--[acetyl-CoA-carboxylase] ligase [Candidatus Omnitrophota bacterium]
MEEKILKLFRKNEDGYLSGEEISDKLGVSRSAVWKHIEKLRGLGYEFDAVPHLGYRIRKKPDKLYAFELEAILKNHVIGKRVLYYDTISSTNTTAYDLAKKGFKEGTTIIAEGQSKGRGRLAREWSSPKQKGIYLSIILRPNLLPYQAPKITLITAVSICEAIRGYCGAEVLIKWPNDILLNNKKVAGILTEMEAEQDSINFLILGIGINVNTRISELPKGASSISEEAGDNILRIELLKVILETFEQNYATFKREGFSPFRHRWKNLSATLGRRVRATCMHRKIEGEAVDIDSDGALKIRLDTGFHEKVVAGDVMLLR